MTTEYKILGQKYIGLTTYSINNGYGYGYGYGYSEFGAVDEALLPVTVYTVPSEKSAIVSSIYIVNHDTSPITCDLAMVPSGEDLAVKHHIRWDYPIPASNFHVISIKLTMAAGDKLIILPSVADKVSVTAFGMELQ